MRRNNDSKDSAMTPSSPAYDWANTRGTQWRDQLDGMEAMLAPVDGPLMAALALDGPCRIADIGCGGGATTQAIADAAPDGSGVEGFDISPDLVEAATRRAGGRLRFTVADAGSYRPAVPFDRITSRFGVMFFADPAAAFANLARWLVPGGRLAFAVWGPGPKVTFMAAVKAAMAGIVDVAPAEADAPGPCRYGDPESLIALLRDAGLSDVQSQPWHGELCVGGGMGAQAAADFLLASSSSAVPIRDSAPELRAQACAALAGLCARHERDGAVWMPATVNIVTARAPA